jgi:glycosyltransferase involved in cell wall biosynthesis
VSTFIAEQMMLQWGFKSEVIDNGIDTDKFKPVEKKSSNGEFFDGRLIIHGTTTVNKGFDHIEAVRRVCPNDQVLSLDEAAEFLKMSKYEALANADLVVHPSAHEGNSYFVLETLACGIPLISYNVGLMYHSWRDNQKAAYVLDRNERSPEKTAAAVVEFFDKGPPYKLRPRAFAEQHSIQQFHDDWKEYLIDHESSNETSNKSR